MARPGTKPKPEDQRRNPTNRALVDWVQVVDKPYAGKVPRLPWTPMPETKRWWQVVTKMPHCVLWDDGDWQFAVDTAHVHEVFLKTGQINAASELRQREKLMGMTWDARRDLRIKYVEAVEDDSENAPVSIADRRRELEG